LRRTRDVPAISDCKEVTQMSKFHFILVGYQLILTKSLTVSTPCATFYSKYALDGEFDEGNCV
jgi:hypothetical protein